MDVENSENGNVLGVFVLKNHFAIFRCSVAAKSPNQRIRQNISPLTLPVVSCIMKVQDPELEFFIQKGMVKYVRM